MTDVGFHRLGMVGRLGNSLYQLASTIGVAHGRSSMPRFNANWDYRSVFSIPSEFFNDDRTGCTDLEDCEELTSIDARARVYAQNWNLFAAIMPTIRAYLAPSLRAREAMDACVDFWSLRRPVLGVHVRRGDNAPGADLATPEKWRYHGCPDASYYLRGIDVLAENAASIVVFGDDPDWNEENLSGYVTIGPTKVVSYFHRGVPRPKEDQPGYADEPRDWIDWQLLASCDAGIVCSNSTFSVFAALVAGGPAVVPTPFFGPELMAYIDPRLLHPSDWTRLPC